MDLNNTGLVIKRPIGIKVIVTSLWKQEVGQQLQSQINQVDSQIQQIDVQGQRAISELQKQSLTSINLQLTQQVENIQGQVNQKKNELLDKKNQLLQQLEQLQLLELGNEVSQGQIEGLARVEKGDNLIRKLNVEVVMLDGVIQEIRGEI